MKSGQSKDRIQSGYSQEICWNLGVSKTATGWFKFEERAIMQAQPNGTRMACYI